jgi:hypothetical protein
LLIPSAGQSNSEQQQQYLSISGMKGRQRQQQHTSSAGALLAQKQRILVIRYGLKSRLTGQPPLLQNCNNYCQWYLLLHITDT